MGRFAFAWLCNISCDYDRIIGFCWMEGHSYFLKFYCLNAYLNMAMNIHLTVRYLQFKKEIHQFDNQQAVLEASKKMMLPIFYTVLTTICAFLSLILVK